jgi:hypothetical protein
MSAPDYYAIGTMVDEDDVEVGALVNTPSSILAEMNTVRSMVETLNNAIVGSDVRAVFRQNWEIFRKEFESFYKAHEGWSSRLWGAALEKTLEYKTLVAQWHEAFKKEGGKPVAGAGMEVKRVSRGSGLLPASL